MVRCGIFIPQGLPAWTATLLLDAGIDILEVQKLPGQPNPRIPAIICLNEDTVYIPQASAAGRKE